MKHFLITTTSIAGLAMCGATSVAAQTVEADATDAPTPATAPTDPTLAAMQLERDREKADQERIQAKLAAEKARIEYALLGVPQSDTKGVDGSVKVENAGGYYADILAFDAMSEISKSIACAVKVTTSTEASNTSGLSKIVLTDTLNYGPATVLYTVLETRMTTINDRLGALLSDNSINIAALPVVPGQSHSLNGANQSFLAVLGLIPGLLGVAREASQFFQTERTISGRVIEVKQATLEVSIAKYLLANDKGCTGAKSGHEYKIVLPGIATNESNESLFKRFKTLSERSAELVKKKISIDNNAAVLLKVETDLKKVAEANIVNLKKSLAAATTAGDTALMTNLKSQIDVQEKIVKTRDEASAVIKANQKQVMDPIDQALTAAEALMTVLTTANDAGKTPLQVTAIVDQIAGGNTYMLSADIASMGSELQITKKSWNGKVGYLGGSVVTYVLVSKDGVLMSADQLKSVKTSRFKRSYDIKELERSPGDQ